MKIKNVLIFISCILILFLGFLVYKNSCEKFKIINKSNEVVTIKITGENNKNIEDISINKSSTKTIKLPKDETIINIMYHYDNGQSLESFEIVNKEINEKYSKMIIHSIDNTNKIIADFK